MIAPGDLLIIRQIWRSSGNTIWLAKTTQDLLVAVKVPNSADSDSRIRRLSVEAWFLNQFANIPNIMPLLRYDVSIPNEPKLIMPYMSGGSLSRLIHTEPRNVVCGAKAVSTVADALQQIHTRGILHLDVKPHNIILDATGQPFLTDFGHAAFCKPSALDELYHGALTEYLTARLETVPGGTWEYSSPEQFDSPPQQLSPASDIYSLGVLLFEVLTGATPYESRAENRDQRRQELRELHRKGSVLDIVELNVGLEGFAGMTAVVSKALQPVPEARYENAASLAMDIRRVLRIA